MNGVLGIIIIAFALYAYCALMDFSFKQALGEASGDYHVDSVASEVRPEAATVQTSLADFWHHAHPVEDFHIKFCRGCVKRTGFSYGECNLCALPSEDADLKPALFHQVPLTHMQWAKARALAELPNHMLAIASMTSDMRKHPETEALEMMCAMFAMTNPNAETTKHFIEGFNDALGVSA